MMLEMNIPQWMTQQVLLIWLKILVYQVILEPNCLLNFQKENAKIGLATSSFEFEHNNCTFVIWRKTYIFACYLKNVRWKIGPKLNFQIEFAFHYFFLYIGVFTWDINRDCDQRMHYPKGEVTRITFLYIISKQWFLFLG